MKTFVVAISFLWCSAAVAQSNQAADGSDKDDSGSAAHLAADNLAKARRLLDLRQLTSFTSASQKAMMAQIVEGMTNQFVQELGRENRSWNPSHPKWQAVCAVVRQDVQASFDQLQQTRLNADADRKKLASRYAAGLGPESVNVLLSYYSSDEGKRFLAFSQSLTAAWVNGIIAFLSNPEEAAARRSPSASNEVLAKRARILKLSTEFQMLASNSKNGGDSAGLGMLAGLVAASQGDALDKVAAQYESDLSRFEQFQKTPENIAELKTIAGIVEQSRRDMAPVMMKFTLGIEAKQDEWRRLYRKEVANNPASAH